MEQTGATWAGRGFGRPLKVEARAPKHKLELQGLKTKVKARMDVTSMLNFATIDIEQLNSYLLVKANTLYRTC